MGLDRIQVVLEVNTVVLTEDAEACLTVLLPKTFINFGILPVGWRTVNAKATGLTIDPVAFELAAIRPDNLAIAALSVVIVNHTVIALLGSEAPLSAR